MALNTQTSQAETQTRVRAGERLLQARQRLERAIEASAPQPQQAPGRLHVADPLEHDLLLTMAEGARLARFDATAPADPVMAFRKWLRREALPIKRRGRVLLIARRALLAALER